MLAASTLSLLFVNELTHFCDTLCLVILFKPSLGSMAEWKFFTLQSFGKNDGASVARDDGGTRASSDAGPRTLVSKSMLH